MEEGVEDVDGGIGSGWDDDGIILDEPPKFPSVPSSQRRRTATHPIKESHPTKENLNDKIKPRRRRR